MSLISLAIVIVIITLGVAVLLTGADLRFAKKVRG